MASKRSCTMFTSGVDSAGPTLDLVATDEAGGGRTISPANQRRRWGSSSAYAGLDELALRLASHASTAGCDRPSLVQGTTVSTMRLLVTQGAQRSRSHHGRPPRDGPRNARRPSSRIVTNLSRRHRIHWCRANAGSACGAAASRWHCRYFWAFSSRPALARIMSIAAVKDSRAQSFDGCFPARLISIPAHKSRGRACAKSTA